MLRKVQFKQNWRCFKEGDTFEFPTPITLLVGDQGCGKSSLLSTLRELVRGSKNEIEDRIRVWSAPIKVMSFDFERDNPRIQSSFGSGPVGAIAASRFKSHGEVVNFLVGVLQEKEYSYTLFLMDEPDTSLSIRSCASLARAMRSAVSRDCQIIAAVHSLALLEEFYGEEVLSLEHKRRMKAEEFVQSQRRLKDEPTT